MNKLTQQDVINYVSNPENLKKAAEGSMEKRQAVFDKNELREKIASIIYPDTDVEKLLALFTAQLELSKIEAKIEEVDNLPLMFAPYKSTRINELNTQKNELSK